MAIIDSKILAVNMKPKNSKSCCGVFHLGFDLTLRPIMEYI